MVILKESGGIGPVVPSTLLRLPLGPCLSEVRKVREVREVLECSCGESCQNSAPGVLS